MKYGFYLGNTYLCAGIGRLYTLASIHLFVGLVWSVCLYCTAVLGWDSVFIGKHELLYQLLISKLTTNGFNVRLALLVMCQL